MFEIGVATLLAGLACMGVAAYWLRKSKTTAQLVEVVDFHDYQPSYLARRVQPGSWLACLIAKFKQDNPSINFDDERGGVKIVVALVRDKCVDIFPCPGKVDVLRRAVEIVLNLNNQNIPPVDTL